MNPHLLSAFIATCLLVSLTPGLCSILCLTLATTIGIRRTQWMMVGELFGMGTVAAVAVLGIATVLHLNPTLFTALKIGGSLYLVYLGWKMWRLAPEREMSAFKIPQTRLSLASLGYATAVTNPKVWALYIALLPPFVDPSKPIALQLTCMLALIVLVELICLYLYAFGGRMLSRTLDSRSSRSHIGRALGILMAAMGIWILAQ